jgi:outer membrane lipoprotein SlyB
MSSMRIKSWLLGFAAGGILAASAGCVSKSNLPVYDSGQVGSVITSQRGEIVSVRDVLIKAPSQSAGSTGMGARIGSAAGRSGILGGPSAIVGAVGAVVGEAAGAVVGAAADNKMGEEITVLVEGGQTITIVQERGDGPPLAIGEKVRLVSGASSGVYGGSSTKTKVVRDDEYGASPARVDRPR